MSRSRSDDLSAKIEELRRKLGALPEGADLGEFLDRECTAFARLLREDLVAGHERSASPQGDFPPSAVSELPERKDVESGSQEA